MGAEKGMEKSAVEVKMLCKHADVYRQSFLF